VRQEETAGPVILVVAAALTRADGRVLLARRPEGKSMAGLWELPGGKLEPGERPERALVRELREELAIEVAEEDLKPWSFASHAYPAFHLLMPVYRCFRWTGAIEPREGQGIAWVAPAELDAYPAPEADIPLFRRLAEEV
jgi:8-oxo-dGTP diphosphatase